MRKRKWVAALVATAVVSGVAVAAALAAPSRPAAGKTYYYIPKDTLNPYEVIADHGGKLALTALGDTQVVSSGTEDTAAAQQPAIQAAIQAHAAGIVIAGNDPQAVCPALKQAQAQGTKVVAFDSDVNCRSLFINQADTATIGRSQIQLLGKLMHYTGEFAILSAASTATNQNAWIKYMQLELKKPLLRKRQPGSVAAGDSEHAAGVSEPEGDRIAHDGRDLLGRAIPLDLEVQEEGRDHGSRPAEPDEEVRP
jgi:ABC-type sugar transport system substrate-binding protein